MNFLKSNIYSGTAVLSRLLGLLILNKILAITIGPSGYAIVGQFQNFIQLSTTLSSVGINNGVVKYTAEWSDSNQQQVSLWSTSIYMTFVSSIAVSLVIFSYSQKIALQLHQDISDATVKLLAISLVFIAMNFLILSILNGQRALGKYALLIVTNSVISVIFVTIGAKNWGVNGALNALSIFQIFGFFVGILLLKNANWFRFDYRAFNLTKVMKLFNFSLMAIVTVFCMPLVLILIRTLLVKDLGASSAGIWEGMWRLSSAMMMVFTSILSVYYLPRFSELNKSDDLRREIKKCIKYIAPIILIILLIVFYCKTRIIILLFTKDFLEMSQLFMAQLVGDFFKFFGWLFGYLLIAKAQVFRFISLEIIFSIMLYLLTVYFVDRVGLKGTSIAYATNNLLYSTAVILSCYRLIRKEK